MWTEKIHRRRCNLAGGRSGGGRGPDDFAVGFGDAEGGEGDDGVPFEAAFFNFTGGEVDGMRDFEAEHEPVCWGALAFAGRAAREGAFGDDAEHADFWEGECRKLTSSSISRRAHM